MTKKLSEKEKAEKLQGSFDLDESQAYRLFKEKFGFIPTVKELVRIGKFFQIKTGIKIGRDDNRRVATIFQVFEKNLDVFKDFIERLSFQDNKGNFSGPAAKEFQDYIEKHPEIIKELEEKEEKENKNE